eukprot:CAMPEP_0181439500 /NCGR_PEP_ID=MMETSP1110-20121109/22461_1 /TAXON_ID=174948 /ORGANISM="Symbiodinium sp., Strain CCMP421" /LENGTH=79 /DNA_ID=CAMNT_0023563229 /DNA_START=52 /DNA_END=291 /DNA_ORIENTATION=-
MTGLKVITLVSWLLAMAQAQRSVASKYEGQDLIITPNIMTGLLIGALWFVLFLTGICCLFQVQTPSAFEEKALVINKNY